MTLLPLLLLLLPLAPAARPLAPPPAPVDCGEQPNWMFADKPGDWTQAPPLPWGRELLGQPVSASLALFFTGNNSGPNSAALNARLARFGHVGIGWQLTGSAPNSHIGHLEVVERAVAAQLKALNPRVKVLALRNDQVVSPLWDCARARMLDPASAHFFLRNASGAPLSGGLWAGTKTQPLLAGAVVQYWLNFSVAAARDWWADVFVGGALAEANIDGAFFDCACNSVLPDAQRVRHNAAARPAVEKVLADASRRGKLLTACECSNGRLGRTVTDSDGRPLPRTDKPNGPTAACDKPQVSKQLCAEPLRYFISLGKNTSKASTMIMLHGFGGRFSEGQELNASVAAFLIARGADGNSLLRLSSCVGCPYNWPTPVWSPLFELTPGKPLADGAEVAAGVFRRDYTRMTVQLDCNTFAARFEPKEVAGRR